MSSRGVFLLSDILEQQLEGTGVSTTEVFTQTPPESSRNRGYFSGGLNPSGSAQSTTDKILYSTNTTSHAPGADLVTNRFNAASAGTLDIGYIGGGGPSSITLFEKVTYSNETRSAVPGMTLDAVGGGQGRGAVGNRTVGFWCGGNGANSNSDKITYATETAALTTTANLSSARFQPLYAGNTTTGYMCGGFMPGSSEQTDKVTYPTDTTSAVPAANLSSARYGGSGFGNAEKGYFIGGSGPGGGSPLAVAERLLYSSDSMSLAPTANLTSARYMVTGTSSFGSGFTAGGGPDLADVDITDYSTDTTEALPGTGFLSAGRRGVSGYSSKENASPGETVFPFIQFKTGLVSGPNTGYVAGGGPLANRTTFEKTDYSTDTTLPVPGANLTVISGAQGRFVFSAIGSPTDGYFGGGNPSSTDSTMDKITYSSDTTGLLPSTANLSAARYGFATTGNETHGYFGGGRDVSGNYKSEVDKMTFSSDTTIPLPMGNLTGAGIGDGLAATGNLTAGYFSGGRDGVIYADTVATNKTTYASDTTVRIPGADLSSPRWYTAASGNMTEGYFAGGLINKFGAPNLESTSVSVLSYSTETHAISPTANLSGPIFYHSASGNSSAGYFTGGYTNTPPAATKDRADKISYATQTRSATPGGNLNLPRDTHASTGSRATGIAKPITETPTPQTIPLALDQTIYTATGSNPSGRLSSYEKLTSATETVSPVPGANTSVAPSIGSFNGSKTEGFTSGGVNDVYTGTDRITYATDSVSYVPGMDMLPGPSFYGATPVSTQTLGYLMGGRGGGSVPANASFVQKLDYAGETNARVPTADMPSPRRYGNPIGSTTNGYLIAGSNSGSGIPTTSETDTVKLSYADETCSALPAATVATWGTSYNRGAGVNNPSHGYLNTPQPNSPRNNSTVYKFTLSSETIDVAPSASLASVHYNSSASGDHTTGYFMGGSNPAPWTMLQSISKISFATDTSSASPASLTVERRQHVSRSDSDQGLPAASIGIPVIC